MSDPRRLTIAGPFPPLRGGIAQFNDSTARALEQRGHRVARASFSRLYPGFAFPGRSPYEPGASPDPEARLDNLNPATWYRTGRAIASSDTQAVIAAYWMPLVAPALGTVIRRSGKPVVGLVHNALPHEKLPFSGTLARWFLGACDAVLTLSEPVAQAVRELGFKGVVGTTPHPVYDRFPDPPTRAEARLQLGVEPDAPMLLFFGLVRAYKGVDLLIEAMPALLRGRPDAVLFVAGEWFERARPARDRILGLGLESAVKIEDAYIPDDRVALLFAAADVVVLPYRSGTQSGVLETAARYGVPMVVTDVEGLAAPVRRYGAGVIVPRAEPAGLVSGIDEALRRGTELRAGAARMADAHGWTPFCEQLETLIEGAIAGRTRSARHVRISGQPR